MNYITAAITPGVLKKMFTTDLITESDSFREKIIVIRDGVFLKQSKASSARSIRFRGGFIAGEKRLHHRYLIALLII